MSADHINLSSMLGLDPEHFDTTHAITRYRTYCESVGLDPNQPGSVAKVDRLRDIEWRISALDLDRWGNIHSWGSVLFEEGQEAANKVAAERRAELHEAFAAYERAAGRRHPDDDRPVLVDPPPATCEPSREDTARPQPEPTEPIDDPPELTEKDFKQCDPRRPAPAHHGRPSRAR